MGWVTVAIHGDLNDFLPPHRPGPLVRRRIDGRPAAKDVLEAIGVPHPEIAALTVNERPARLGDPIRDDDRVEAWPADQAAALGLPIVPEALCEPGQEPTFVVDGHLGRLAAYLRMLGLDAWHERAADDDRLAGLAAARESILLTRDRALLKRAIVRRGHWLRSDQPVEQLVDVVRRFDLVRWWQPFGRCLSCNSRLIVVSREAVLDRLERLTRAHYDDFRRCPGCDAVYWKGSHHARMERLIERVADRVGAPADRSAWPAGAGRP